MSLDSSRFDQDGVDRFSYDSSYDCEENKERELLSCCFCGAPLEAMILKTDHLTGDERFLWACRNMKKKACFFPMGIPSEIFYVTRTADEKKRGYMPKPDIRLLPPKYRGLYPATFANTPTTAANLRTGTSTSAHTTDVCSYSTHTQSPSTSRSVSSENATTDQILQQGHDAEVGTANGKRVGSNLDTPMDKDVDDGKSISAGTNTDSTYSSTEVNDVVADEALTDIICDQLHGMGIDMSRLEDEELLSKMADVVKKLDIYGRRGRNHLRHIASLEHRNSVNYLHNLDVASIKRRLNVLSTDLTRAVAVMRSGCDLETMLSAIGGKLSMAIPPVKRSRIDNREELKRRVDVVLKKLASSANVVRNDVTTPTEATPTVGDTAGEKEWYEEEDGPTISNGITSDNCGPTSAAEEARLNAIVQNSVRLQIANSAARRNAYRQEKIRQTVGEIVPPPSHIQVPSPMPDSEAVSAEYHTNNDGLPLHHCSDLSSSANNTEEVICNDSYSPEYQEQPVSCVTTASPILHTNLPNSVDIEFGLFDEFELMC